MRSASNIRIQTDETDYSTLQLIQNSLWGAMSNTTFICPRKHLEIMW